MSITFRCGYCHKEVNAPDDAVGKTGKCPYCGRSSYIPSAVSEEEIIPLAPLDEEEERKRRKESETQFQRELELLEGGGQTYSGPPLEHREEVKSEDLHHFVVNYCLDMANSNLQRAKMHIRKLKGFGQAGVEAVDDFISGKTLEPALDMLATELVKGLLKELKDELSKP